MSEIDGMEETQAAAELERLAQALGGETQRVETGWGIGKYQKYYNINPQFGISSFSRG